MIGYTIEELEILKKLLNSERLLSEEKIILDSILQEFIQNIGCDRNNCPYANNKGGNCSEMVCNCNKLNITKKIILGGWPARFKECPYYKFTKIDKDSRYCDENGTYTPIIEYES